jgi:thiosulfate sulfurtransferase
VADLISLEDLNAILNETILIDVRKPAAIARSGLAMSGAVHRHPFAASSWANEFKGKNVVVFCVHGHEVSQAVAGFLVDVGVKARYLAGGFEAWRAAGGKPVALPKEDGGNG